MCSGAGTAALPLRVPGPSLSSHVGRWHRERTEKAAPAWRWGSREQDSRRCTIETEKEQSWGSQHGKVMLQARQGTEYLNSHTRRWFVFPLQSSSDYPLKQIHLQCAPFLFRSSRVEFLGGTLGHPIQAPGPAW